MVCWSTVYYVKTVTLDAQCSTFFYRNGKTLHVVTEEYTSRTCMHCLCVQKRFSSKVFKCPLCGYGPVNRDIKATQCIMLMHMQPPAGGGSGSGSGS